MGVGVKRNCEIQALVTAHLWSKWLKNEQRSFLRHTVLDGVTLTNASRITIVCLDNGNTENRDVSLLLAIFIPRPLDDPDRWTPLADETFQQACLLQRVPEHAAGPEEARPVLHL